MAEWGALAISAIVYCHWNPAAYSKPLRQVPHPGRKKIEVWLAQGSTEEKNPAGHDQSRMVSDYVNNHLS